ncbi:MAG: lamin tail domain-containing protein [Patescibacteria group bacterium]
MRCLNRFSNFSYNPFRGVWFLLLIIFIPFTNEVIAASGIVINEFQISSPQSVEIINTTDKSVDIGGYYLDDSGGSTYYTVPSSTSLLPYQCKVFQSDFNFNSSSADTVRLIDKNTPPNIPGAIIIDSYSYSSAPQNGINYSRVPDGTGNFSQQSASLGYYNSSGVNCESQIFTPTPTLVVIPTPSPTLTPSQAPTTTITPTPTQDVTIPPSLTQTSTPSPSPTYFKNKIYLSEIMPNPTSGNEWVEIYNDNNFKVSLTDYWIDDLEDSGGAPQKFSIDLDPNSYGTIELAGSLLNNDNDFVRLLDNENNELKIFSYLSSRSGISWGAKNPITEESFCLQYPSKNLQNNECIIDTPTQTLTPTKTPSPTKTPTPTMTPTPTAQSIDGVYITEFSPRTNSLDQNEWVEIYNDNSYPVTLNNWSIGDEDDPQYLDFSTDIDPYRFAVISFTSSKLNNDGDTVYLNNNNGKIVDSFTYSESDELYTWGRKKDDFGSWCLQPKSKNAFNNYCADLSTPTPTPSKTPSPTRTRTPTRSPTPSKVLIALAKYQTSSDSKMTGSVEGASTINLSNKTMKIDYTPQKNSQTKVSQPKATSDIEEDEIPPDSNPTDLLSLIATNSIMTLLLIIICSVGAGALAFDLWRNWSIEKYHFLED